VWGQQAEKTDEAETPQVQVLPAAAFAADASDDELTALLKERYRTAVEEVAILREISRGQFDPLFDLRRCSEAETRLAHDALELCKTSEQRIAVLQKLVDSLKVMEDLYERRAKLGVISTRYVLTARHDRLDAEIELARAKREAKEKK
jgi:hypothetical protein